MWAPGCPCSTKSRQQEKLNEETPNLDRAYTDTLLISRARSEPKHPSERCARSRLADAIRNSACGTRGADRKSQIVRAQHAVCPTPRRSARARSLRLCQGHVLGSFYYRARRGLCSAEYRWLYGTFRGTLQIRQT